MQRWAATACSSPAVSFSPCQKTVSSKTLFHILWPPTIYMPISPMKSNMASRILSLLLLVASGFLISCDKLPDNGNLDGMWQLMTVEDGDEKSVKDTKVYWSIRTNLVQLSSIDGTRMYAHFEKMGKAFEMYDLCYNSKNANPTDNNEWIPFEDREILFRFGILAEKDAQRSGRLHQLFRVETLTENTMVLCADTYKLRFRKF